MPSQGDHWEFGQDLASNVQGWDWLARSFVIASGGGGAAIQILSFNSAGLTSVLDPDSFYSPSIDTPLLKINGTNISELHQSKAGMTIYITSGTLTNYVNTTSNQILLGETDSQAV